MSRPRQLSLRLESPRTGSTPEPAEVDRAADDGFPHLPLLEEQTPEIAPAPAEDAPEEER